MLERFGPYVLLKPLGRGGMGDVHLARPIDRARAVPEPLVIKRLHAELGAMPRFVRRFQHEALMATLIDDEHVAKVFDAGRVGSVLYIAMEYVHGWPLSNVIERLLENQTPPSLGSVGEIAQGLLAGLHAIHRASDEHGDALDFIHRDLAPKNIMLGEDGGVRIIDLGIGKSRMQDWKTATGAIIGSPGYMSPEQARGEAVDQRSDLYSVAAVLYELLTLTPVIHRGPLAKMIATSAQPEIEMPSSIRPELSRDVDQLFRRGLALDPRERFQDARQFRAALENVFELSDASEPSTLVYALAMGGLASQKTAIEALMAQTIPTFPPTLKVPRTEIYAVRSGTRSESFTPTAITTPASSAAAPTEGADRTQPAAEDLRLTPPEPRWGRKLWGPLSFSLVIGLVALSAYRLGQQNPNGPAATGGPEPAPVEAVGAVAKPGNVAEPPPTPTRDVHEAKRSKKRPIKKTVDVRPPPPRSRRSAPPKSPASSTLDDQERALRTRMEEATALFEQLDRASIRASDKETLRGRLAEARRGRDLKKLTDAIRSARAALKASPHGP